MSEAILKLERTLYQLIESEKLVLPTLPEVAIQIRQAMSDPEIGIAQLTKVLSRDAALSARLVKVANSPLFRGQSEIADIQMAVSRLGRDYTCNLATGLAIEQMFKASDPMIDKKLREVWNQSTQVASVAHVLAKHYTSMPPDQATLAGLMHLIGVLPVITFAEQHPNVIKSEEILDRVIKSIHGGLGTHLLQHWGFSDDIALVPEQSHKPYRTVAEPDISDVILVARLQSIEQEDDIDITQVSAFARLGLATEIEELDAEDINEEIDEAKQLFR